MIPDTDLRALKTAFFLLVKRVGGLHAAAACVRVSASHLARYYDHGEASTFPPADVFLGLELVAGEALVTAEIARISGQRLVALDAADGSHLAETVASFARGAGAVPATLCAGLADGVLTQAELGQIASESLRQAQLLTEIAAEARALAATTSPAPPGVEGEGAPAGRGPPPGRAGGRQPRGRR
jgi:hypothetical protein